MAISTIPRLIKSHKSMERYKTEYQNIGEQIFLFCEDLAVEAQTSDKPWPIYEDELLYLVNEYRRNHNIPSVPAYVNKYLNKIENLDFIELLTSQIPNYQLLNGELIDGETVSSTKSITAMFNDANEQYDMGNSRGNAKGKKTKTTYWVDQGNSYDDEDDFDDNIGNRIKSSQQFMPLNNKDVLMSAIFMLTRLPSDRAFDYCDRLAGIQNRIATIADACDSLNRTLKTIVQNGPDLCASPKFSPRILELTNDLAEDARDFFYHFDSPYLILGHMLADTTNYLRHADSYLREGIDLFDEWICIEKENATLPLPKHLQ